MIVLHQEKDLNVNVFDNLISNYIVYIYILIMIILDNIYLYIYDNYN